MKKLFKLCLAVVLALSARLLIAQNEQSEVIPLFQPKPSASSSAFSPLTIFIAATLQIPFMAQVDDVKGEVRIRVHLNAQREAVAFKVIQKLRPDCDQEALRVARLIHPRHIDEFSKGQSEVDIPFYFTSPNKVFYAEGFKVEYFDSFQEPTFNPDNSKFIRRYAVDSLTGRITGDALYLVFDGKKLQVGAKVTPTTETRAYTSPFAENQLENTNMTIVKLDGSQKFTTVTDSYFANGQVAEKTTSENNKYTYFPNGRIATQEEQFGQGGHTTRYIDWYPSGQLRSMRYMVKHILSERFMYVYDSSGHELVKAGNGFCTLSEYQQGKTVQVLSGKVVNGSKDGLWEGIDPVHGFPYKEEYSKGKLIEGVMTGEGNEFWYKDLITRPEMTDGTGTGFQLYIAPYLKYPADAVTQRISGKVSIAFEIDEVGNMNNLHVSKSVYRSLDEVALKAVAHSSRHWKPATRRGKAIKYYPYILPIPFVLSE